MAHVYNKHVERGRWHEGEASRIRRPRPKPCGERAKSRFKNSPRTLNPHFGTFLLKEFALEPPLCPPWRHLEPQLPHLCPPSSPTWAPNCSKMRPRAPNDRKCHQNAPTWTLPDLIFDGKTTVFSIILIFAVLAPGIRIFAHLASILVHLGSLLGPTLTALDPSWPQVGTIWAQHGPHRRHHGAILAQHESCWRHHDAILGSSFVTFARNFPPRHAGEVPRAHLEPLQTLLGPKSSSNWRPPNPPGTYLKNMLHQNHQKLAKNHVTNLPSSYL